MIATKMMTAAILVVATALSASATNPGEYPPCATSRRQEGKRNDMQPVGKGYDYHFVLNGFTLDKVSPGVFDLQAGPTMAGYAVMKPWWSGAGYSASYRFELTSWQKCTARFPEGPVGSGMGVIVETF